tara:strand:+ start:216 stop:440 length:225 start_codon:yes stop_codon:yes gene_type:complete
MVKRKLKKELEKEVEELKSEKRKLVQNIEGIFHILHDDCFVNKDELSELMELLDKYKSPECLLLSDEASSIIQP